ncbi:MAG TPA: PQQ-binding-like beta-propeller repeat protein [Acidimicrobiales bacterium]|nr:PQQ-binding-like beta-propeller repeat protein [Acidimicrobiales bacterium]
MKNRLTGRTRIAVAGFVAGSLVVATGGLVATVVGASPAAMGSWPYANGNLANTRVAVGSTITLANVVQLKEIWSYKLTGKSAKSDVGTGTLTANPIVVNGVVYMQDLRCDVFALSLSTGRLLWKFMVNKPEVSGPGPNGVAVVDGTVYGQTPTAAFALDATTGKALWEDKHLLKKGQGTFGIQPQVANGRDYLASQYGVGAGGGVLIALDAANGAVLWKFNTLTRADKGVVAEGVGSGGAWQTPLVSSNGSVTYGIGNPYQTVENAIKHPSAQLYTDSDVNLNAATGKLNWSYQGVPNDFKDYDMQASPISTTARGVPVVIGGGKMGYVYEMNASTGALLWKTPVGEHNGHDNDSLKALHHQLKLKTPFTILPGNIGGILTNMAVADNSVYVATIDIPITYDGLKQVLGSASGAQSGEVEALNLTTGEVEWDTKVKDIPCGAVTVSNDLVFTTLLRGTIIALNRATGAIVFKQKLPDTTNAPLAIAGNTVIVPAGGPKISKTTGVSRIVAYAVS